MLTTGGEKSGKDTSDVLVNPQMMNGYSYATGNPLKYTDPTGEWIVPAAIDPSGNIPGIAVGQKYDPKPLSTGEKITIGALGTLATGGMTAVYPLISSAIATAVNATNYVGELVLGGKAGETASKIGGKQMEKAGSGEKIIQNTRSKIINAEKAAASAKQMKNLGHRTIEPFKDAAFKAKEYGGKASDYIKQSSHKYESSDRLKIEIHSVKNRLTNKIYELKSVIENIKIKK